MAETERAEVLWTKGIHLATRMSVFHTAALYQIDGFYVEIIYSEVDNKIVKTRSFESTELLEPYLIEIDISFLMTNI